ncbi:MAG: nicotinate-nucleotide adenylyltransferase [Nitrospirae bacterium]|nr:nicotinate-nucleotide adenylyltransferase [Nitrospirota bacterium]
MKDEKMKLGIFGGTFNPIHYGHLRAAEEVRGMHKLDKILFIPSGRTPFKKPELASGRRRYEMTKIAVRGNPSFDVSDIELKRRGVSYTVDTLISLTGKYKSAEFFLILGIDAFLDLPSWKEPDKLLGLANIVVISRPGFSFTDLASSQYFKGVSLKTLRRFDKGDKASMSFKAGAGSKIFLCRITGLDISASGARRLIRSGKSIKYLLPDSVESYIISNKIYK